MSAELSFVPIQEVTPRHEQIAALLAQGMPQVDIAVIMGMTPARIWQLINDPMFKQHLAEKSAVVDAQLEAQYQRIPEMINKGFNSDQVEDNLKAARLQLEVTKRLGKHEAPREMESSVARLEALAERLVALNRRAKEPTVIDAEVEK